MKRLLLSSALLCAAIFPAAARPRDEVMSNAFRCAPIGDLRLWLDCFYGAAQPVRASLAMTPAPQAQLKLVTAPPSGPVGPQDTKLRDGVLAHVVERRDAGDREVLGDREGHDVGRQLRERRGTEVLLQVAHERRADRLAVQHAAGHERARHRAGGGGAAQQQADLLDLAEAVQSDRDRLDVEDRDTGPGLLELEVGEPAGVRVGGAHGGHAPIVVDPWLTAADADVNAGCHYELQHLG